MLLELVFGPTVSDKVLLVIGIGIIHHILHYQFLHLIGYTRNEFIKACLSNPIELKARFVIILTLLLELSLFVIIKDESGFHILAITAYVFLSPVVSSLLFYLYGLLTSKSWKSRAIGVIIILPFIAKFTAQAMVFVNYFIKTGDTAYALQQMSDFSTGLDKADFILGMIGIDTTLIIIGIQILLILIVNAMED